MVLDDHVKVGRKLVPPLLAMGPPIQLGAWPMERLPELFWLDMAAKRVGAKESFELALEMTEQIQTIVSMQRNNNQRLRAYLISEHLELVRAEQEEIVRKCRRAKWLKELKPLFADLGLLFANFPMRYLTPKKSICDTTQVVGDLRSTLGGAMHRHDISSLIMQASAIAIELSTGATLMAQGLTVPDLNSVLEYPETEESRIAAGFVVTMCNTTINCRRMDEAGPTHAWPRSFWNRCYRLQACENG